MIETLVEIELENAEDFLKIKETLTRIGIEGKGNCLYQTCHILHKRGRYYIVHFKELYMLDGRESTFNERDKGRRNAIARLLEEWELLKQVDPEKTSDPFYRSDLRVIPHKEKQNWTLSPKYLMGRKRREY